MENNDLLTYTATMSNHGVGCNYSVYLVGKDEKDAINDFFRRKCNGVEVLSIVQPVPGSYHVEHEGRDQYVHHGARGEGIEMVYSDDFCNIKEVENG